MSNETKVSGPVDVLAWLDSLHATTADGAVTNRKWMEAQEARAAVAELIEAARRAAVASCRGDDFHPGTIRNADLDALRAALANVGGAK